MKFNLRFNWFEVLFYSFFVTYGYFGLMTKLTIEINLLQFITTTFVLSVIQGLFGYLAQLKSELANESLSLSRKDLSVFGGLFVTFLIVVFTQLNWAMYVDELSYGGAAHIHSIQGLLRVGRFLGVFADVPFKYLTQFLSFILLTALILVVWITHKFSWKLKTFSIISLLIFSRLFIYVLGGNGSPHPSFELIMPFIFGAVFGFTHIVFKLSYFFSVMVFLFIVFKKLQQRIEGPVLYLAVMAIGTIPLLLHMSTIVDHSIWAGLAISYVFIEMLMNPAVPYFRLVCVICIATMMRQSCFIALIPVGIHFGISYWKTLDRKQTFKNIGYLLLPALFFIPFVGKSLIYGTPATQAIAASSPWRQLQMALTNPIVFIAAANAVNLWWLAFIPFAILFWYREFRKLCVCFCFFMVAAFIIFYSIHPGLWGYPKYQVEFIVPLSIVGFLMVLISLIKIKGSSKIIATILLLLSGLNIYAYLHTQDDNRPVDELVSMAGKLSKSYQAGYRGLVSFPFNYKEAFADMSKLNLAGHTLVAGGSYGIFQEILAGYSLSEALVAHQIYKDQHNQIFKVLEDNSVVFDAEKANLDSRINAILMGPIPLEVKIEAIKKLQNLGWKSYKTYSNTEYGSSLTLMLR